MYCHVLFSAAYSLDRMSDDDDDEPGPSQRMSAGEPITVDQLAQALTAAAGAAGSQPTSSQVGAASS